MTAPKRPSAVAEACADSPCAGCDWCQPDQHCVISERTAWRADCTICDWFGALRGTELAAKFDARDHDRTPCKGSSEVSP